MRDLSPGKEIPRYFFGLCNHFYTDVDSGGYNVSLSMKFGILMESLLCRPTSCYAGLKIVGTIITLAKRSYLVCRVAKSCCVIVFDRECFLSFLALAVMMGIILAELSITLVASRCSAIFVNAIRAAS